MKAVKRAAAMLLCAVLALSMLLGCSLKADPNQAVATVNGAKISKGEFDDTVTQFTNLYSQFGMDPTTDPSMMADVMNSSLESLIQNKVLEQKAKELGFDKITLQEAKAAVADYYPELKSYRDQMAEQAKKEGAADIEKRVDELLENAITGNGGNMEDFNKSLIEQYKEYKLKKSVEDTVTITDEEVKAWYDTNVKKQTDAVKSDPTSFEQYDATNPALVIPEGYVAVKQIFLKPADDSSVSTKLSDFDTKLGDTATKLANLIKEGKDKNGTEYVALEAELAKIRSDSAAVRDAWLAPAKAKAEEVYAKVTAGNDFQALIDQYNDDPGMKSEPVKTRGYYVGKNTTAYVQPFKDAALALVNIGDVSPIVSSEQGFHILKLVEKLTPGVVPFDKVKDLCKAKALEEKQAAAYEAKVKEWVAAAKVVKYEDKLNIPKVAATAAPEAPAATETSEQ